MKKTLVVLAHPSIEKRSIANKLIIKKIRAIKDVKIKALYQEYPSLCQRI
jgi:hypothetical protein